MRPGAVYVSARKREYYITQHSNNLWKIHKYKGGDVNKMLKGFFSTHRDAEMRLINYLKQNDKFGKARYPGKDG